MRALVRSEVEVAAPADVVWDYVTDWRRQGEWIPFTTVHPVGRADGVGGRVRARTGVGPVGFWDPMTITAWEVTENGSARCEMLHTGRLVRGEAEFSVVERGFSACTFLWWEHLSIPGGPFGALAWRISGRGMQKLVDLSLRRMASRVE
ncbi:MAG TPA: SRPBCC family protein [Nocardioidaceae bacterium]|nr:SRPBCC family protein [Nocardioidaceae bacterium]